ncbi:MAG: inositol monophosphatase family protein [Alphaproteobacteria bacterium]
MAPNIPSHLPDPHAVTAILKDVADQEILPYFGKLKPVDISQKSDKSLVTVIDPAAEALLSRRLSALWPDASILGEEAASDDPTQLTVLDDPTKPIWVIDPLDGTANFVAEKPFFGMIVALVLNKKTLAGWIYDIPNKRIATAFAGQGAFIAGHRVLTGPRIGTLDRYARRLVLKRHRPCPSFLGKSLCL